VHYLEQARAELLAGNENMAEKSIDRAIPLTSEMP
jgi:hypothetical protein